VCKRKKESDTGFQEINFGTARRRTSRRVPWYKTRTKSHLRKKWHF